MPFENGKHQEVQPTESKPEAPLTHTEPSIDDGIIAQEIALKPFKTLFGELSEDEKPKLDYIRRAIDADGKLESDEVIAKIRSLESRLGTLQMHDNRLDRVYRYLKMANSVHEQIVGAL